MSDQYDDRAAELLAEWRAGSDLDSRFIRIVAAELCRMELEIKQWKDTARCYAINAEYWRAKVNG